MCGDWFGSVRACAVDGCASSYRSLFVQSEIGYNIDLNAVGLIAHAPAKLLSWHFQYRPAFFLGLPLFYKGFAPKLIVNEFTP